MYQRVCIEPKTSEINVAKAFPCHCKSRNISHVFRVSHGSFGQLDHYWEVLKKYILSPDITIEHLLENHHKSIIFLKCTCSDSLTDVLRVVSCKV